MVSRRSRVTMLLTASNTQSKIPPAFFVKSKIRPDDVLAAVSEQDQDIPGVYYLYVITQRGTKFFISEARVGKKTVGDVHEYDFKNVDFLVSAFLEGSVNRASVVDQLMKRGVAHEVDESRPNEMIPEDFYS